MSGMEKDHSVHIGDAIAQALPSIKFAEEEVPKPKHHQRYHELLDRSRIPKRHARWSKQDNQCQQWADAYNLIKGRINDCLFTLIGGRGSGKTQMAVNLVRYACSKGRVGMYCKAIEIFMCIKDTFDSKDDTERAVFQKYLNPSVLVIDEIQVRSESQWENNMLTHLIDLRYDQCKSTILIGNLSKENVEAHVGPSIYSRMQQCGEVIDCDWGSFRSGV